MSESTQDELLKSIEELTNYHARLKKEVINISQKLRMSPKKIDSIINSHHELTKIKEILTYLESKQKNNSDTIN